MADQGKGPRKTDGNIYAHKRFRVTFELEAEYGDIEIHPDDEKATVLLRDYLLSDDEAMSKLLLFHCLSRIKFDLPKLLADLGIYDSYATEMVESKARLLPRELLEHLLYLLQAGLGFADELSGEAVQSKISKIQFFDVDLGKEIKMDSRPDPLLYQHDSQRCLLAKGQTEWVALLKVHLNYYDENDNKEAFEKTLAHIDKIQEQVSASELPLREISIGIVAADESEYETARVQIENYAKAKLPGTKTEMWLRQEKRLKSFSMIDLIRMSKTKGGEEN